jgi:hypothetical protein
MNIKIGSLIDFKDMVIMDRDATLEDVKSIQKQGELSLDCVYSFMKLLSLKDLRSALLVCKLWHQVAKDRFFINAFQFKKQVPSLKIADVSPFTDQDKCIILPLDKRVIDATLTKLLTIIKKPMEQE